MKKLITIALILLFAGVAWGHDAFNHSQANHVHPDQEREQAMNDAPCTGGVDPCFVIPKEPECRWEVKGVAYDIYTELTTQVPLGWEPFGFKYGDSSKTGILWLKRCK